MNIKEFFKATNKFILYWFVLGAAVLVAGGVVWYYTPKERIKETIGGYYQSLTKECGFDSCCIQSVKIMKENRYEMVTESGCSEGFQKNRLRCLNSYNWCEPKKEVVFFSQEECEQKTNKSCHFQNCDFIPLGKTFEETCGKDFKKGWVPKNSVLNQTPPEKQKIISKIIFSDIERRVLEFSKR